MAESSTSVSSPASEQVSLAPIFLIVLVDVFGMTLVLPLLAIYAETFHATPLQATLLVSVFAACQFVAGPLIGHWSDRIGRKPMLILSQIGTCLGFIIMARAHTLWVLYVARIIDGATAGNISLAQAYIADNTAPERRTKAMGLIGIAFGLGFFVGPALTGLLSEHYGLVAPIWLAALLSAVSIVCTLTLLKPGHSQAKPPADRRSAFNLRNYGAYFRRPTMRVPLTQFFFYILSFSTFLSGFALFAERRFSWHGEFFGPREIGFVFAYVGLLGVVVQGGLLGRLSAWLGDAKLIAVGFGALILGFLALGFSGALAMLLVAATLLAFGNSVLRPALSSVITKHAERHEQGVIAGVMTSLVSLASIIAPLVGGLLIELNLLSLWALFAASLAIIAAGRGLAASDARDPEMRSR